MYCTKTKKKIVMLIWMFKFKEILDTFNRLINLIDQTLLIKLK